MSKFKAIFGLVWIVGGLTFGGCSGPPDSDDDSDDRESGNDDRSTGGAIDPSGSVDAYCDASCNKNHDCDHGVVVQTCTNNCKSEYAGIAEKARADYMNRLADCYREEDCATVLADDAVDECVEEAGAALSPTPKGKEFCSEYAAALEKCDRELDKADCYDAAKTYGDAALGEAEQCFDKACSDMLACVSATL